MGETGPSPSLPPEKLEAFKRQIDDFEVLGIPTDELKKVLAERPHDFEATARDLLRRAFESPPVTEPPAQLSPESSAESTADPVLAAAEPPSEAVGVPDVQGPPPDEGAAPAPAPPIFEPAPPTDPLAQLEIELAEATAERAPVDDAAIGPEPSAIEEPPEAVGDLEASLEREMEEAVGGADASADPNPPALAGGDSLSMTAPPRAPLRPVPRGGKPPPPRSEPKPLPAVAAEPTRVIAVRAKAAPPGAKPTPAGGAEPAAEVLAVEAPRSHRGATIAVAAILLIAVFAGTYLLLGNAAPTAAFSVSPVAPQAGQPVRFDGSNSSDPNGDPLTFSWDFGDGSNGTGAAVSHIYAHSGTYTVALTVTDSHKSASAQQRAVAVAPGHVDVPVYQYGDRADYQVAATSRVDGFPAGTALTTFTVSLANQEQQCVVTSVNATFTGTQARLVEPGLVMARNGFLDENETYAVHRDVDVLVGGDIANSCPVPVLHFAGNSSASQRDFENLASNDTVRSETDASSRVTITNAQPPRTMQSRAHLIDYPRLANVSGQLHIEEIYAGKSFNTEDAVGGNFTAEGYTWSWITQGTALVGGHLAVKINVTIPERPVTITKLYLTVWVSSASSFPLKEEFYVQGTEPGRQYESFFQATVTGSPTAGGLEIPFANTAVAYRTLGPGESTPLTEVPRATASADFAFTPRQAFDEAYANLTDFRSFMAANPQAYAVNATYGLNPINPKWTIDFAQDKSSATHRIEDEHSTSTLVTSGPGQKSAERTRGQIGSVVTLNYAAGLIKLEEQGAALFPSGNFDASTANFTVRIELKLPTLSFNAASAATRPPVAYAFGGESHGDQAVRTTAYVDAQTGQLMYSVAESGDSLP